MPQNYDVESQEVGKGISLQGKRLFAGKIKWLSLAACLVVLLGAVLTVAQGAFAGTQGAHAAAAKSGVKSPKHAHSPSSVGKSKPVMSVSPGSLSFSASAAAPTPQPQIVTIKNGGTRALYWRTSVSPSTATWVILPAMKAQSLGVRTSSDQPGQLKVYVNATKLSTGTYTAQITLTGTDQQGQAAGGSPQTVTVTLTVS
ncbi:MAG: hypothetical protein JO011_04320 [Ktedonobacteraceae bacterium]|nr:hypothetical protein [Ktedonobacteraceae bacterium]